MDLKVARGEFFFLLGPSGCGKTTLLRIISGLLSPDTGSVLINGKDVTSIPAHKRDVNTVFQNYALFPHMNVFENIAFGLKMKKTPTKEIHQRVHELLGLVGLPDFADRKPSEMSGGQMQRIALARALINRPSVLLLDEPLGALDVKLRKQMQNELRQIQRNLGTTFVCVTHDQEEALALGDRVAVMRNGTIAQIGTARELYNHPESYYVCDFLGECNFLHNVKVSVEQNISVIHIDGYKLMAPTYPGSGNILAVRPEKIRVSENEYELETIDLSTADRNQLPGVLTEIQFVGSLYVLTVELKNGSRFKVHVPNNPSYVLPAPGNRVMLSWDYEDTILLEAET